jgi:phage/plasmid-like protein (TIGR03299 family)
MDEMASPAQTFGQVDLAVTLANRKTPWESGMTWGEAGNPVGEFLTAKDMLEAAGMAGWNVERQQLTLPDGRPVGAYANVATGGAAAGQVLGINGSAYVPRQIEDTFAFADNLVDDGGAHWERAGGFKGGSIVFGALEFKHLGISVPGDDGGISPYLIIIESFDGSYPTMGNLAFVRPRCINTFQAAVGTTTESRFKIRHVGQDFAGKLQLAREALQLTFQHVAETKPMVERLALAKVVDKQVQELFRKLWPVDADAVSDAVLDSHPSTKAFELYQSSETLDGIRGTAWGAFNAVTEFVDHATVYAGKGVSTAADVRGVSTLLGTGEARKEKALGALLKLAKAAPVLSR